MSRRAKREEKVKSKFLYKIIVVAIFLALAFWVLKTAPNYVNTDITDKPNLIINNSNVTKDLKKDVIIQDGVIYISKEDIENFFDPYIYYDEQHNQIVTTSDNQITSMVVGENTMVNNGSSIKTEGTILEKDGTYYIPFSSFKDTYNVDINYIDSTDTVTIDSKDRKYVVADSKKANNVKTYPTIFSRNVDKLEENETVTVVQNDEGQNNVENGWVEIRTDAGKLGYVKQDDLMHEFVQRETIEDEEKFEGNISMVWDYYTENEYAPDRSGTKIPGLNVVSPSFFSLVDEGKGEIYDNAGEAGKNYVTWAHSNGYEVWAMVSNNSYIETTAEIMRDYNLRHELIENIVGLVLEYDLDGINIDFEYMHDEDKDLFSRFIIELKPRLSEIGAILSVDVTAPDGGEEWSLCYDRHIIGDVADYIVFMAYDQNGSSSTTPGTNSGYDWICANLDKFLGQEGVESEKIILGLPFYMRVWEENGDKVDKYILNMNKVDEVVPSDAEKIWDDNLKQYYVEFTDNGLLNRIWIEDEESFRAKLSLIEQYNLAGASYWAKGREPDSIWNVIAEVLNVE